MLENVRREAAVMQYLAERSAGGQVIVSGKTVFTPSTQKGKKSSRMIQHEKEMAIRGEMCADYPSLDSLVNHHSSNSMNENNDSAKNSMDSDAMCVSNGNGYEDGELEKESMAMKGMTIENASKEGFDLLDVEGERYICRFIEETEDEFFHYLINEFVPAGDLYSMLTSFPLHRLNEPQARGLFRQIVLGVRYLHNRNLAHLDMSLENICLDQSEQIRIIDFGVAALHPHTSTSFNSTTNYFLYPSSLQLERVQGNNNNGKEEESSSSDSTLSPNDPRCPRKYFPCAPVLQLHNKPGKIRYMSPELFVGLQWDAFSNDVFSLGVILYSLLTGRPPFQQADNTDVWFNVIYSGQWLTAPIKKQPSAHVYTHLSNEALELINAIIKPESHRLTVNQILAHPWLNIKDE